METSERCECVEVPNDEDVYRRGYPQPRYMNPDGSAHSRNFVLRSGEKGLSVNIASRTTPKNTSIAAEGKEPFYVWQLAVNAIRELGLNVCEDPVIGHETLPENLAHALIIGMEPDDDGIRVELAMIAKRVTLD